MALRRSLAVVLILVFLYLVIGVVVVIAYDQGPTWVCPDPTAPHGETVGSIKKSPECEPMTPQGERVATLAVMTLVWPLLLLGGHD